MCCPGPGPGTSLTQKKLSRLRAGTAQLFRARAWRLLHRALGGIAVDVVGVDRVDHLGRPVAVGVLDHLAQEEVLDRHNRETLYIPVHVAANLNTEGALGWTRRSRKPRINKRGTILPQRGLQYRCAWLVDRGWVRPRRDLDMLHRSLVEGGFAHMFGRESGEGERPVLHEAAAVAARVRAMMGLADA